MRNRRQFLRDVAATAALAGTLRPRRAAAAAPDPTTNKTATTAAPGQATSATTGGAVVPTVVATWDYGLSLVTRAQAQLLAGRDLLDALEAGVNVVEDDPSVMTVGFGGMPNEAGVVQLDAAIFDGRGHRAGAVAAIERIKNPISVARKVMDKTEHVLLAGSGANAFAKKMGFVEQDLSTPQSRAAWKQRKTSFWKVEQHDTVACIGIDGNGDLATAVSTSGLPWKLPGRVGDSPIIGAGSYVDNEIGAACATGVGELTMRTCASFAVVERMRAGAPPAVACTEVLEWIMRRTPAVKSDPTMQLALLAMDKSGQVGAAVYRRLQKVFRFALARGKEPAGLHEVTPLLPT